MICLQNGQIFFNLSQGCKQLEWNSCSQLRTCFSSPATKLSAQILHSQVWSSWTTIVLIFWIVSLLAGTALPERSRSSLRTSLKGLFSAPSPCLSSKILATTLFLLTFGSLISENIEIISKNDMSRLTTGATSAILASCKKSEPQSEHIRFE